MDTGFRIAEIIFILAGTLMLAACGNKSGLIPVHTENTESKADNVMTDTKIQEEPYTEDTKVTDVINDEVFEGYGRLIFPVDMQISDNLTLKNINTILPWYSEINTDKTVEIVNYMKEKAGSGQQIFYDIYSDAEKLADPDKQNTGLFFFKGNTGAKSAIVNAGGGFMYVAGMHDSFPHALELSKKGYNAFALIYRPGARTACEDLARAIAFLHEHTDELGIDMSDYSLWGGSAGARMAAWLGAYGTSAFGEKQYPKPAAVIMQYTGYNSVSSSDAPTYACVGTSDGIANYKTMQNRLEMLESYSIATEFHAYEGLSHGFGIGTGTNADGWIYDAVSFWENQMYDDNIPEHRQLANLQDFLLTRTTNAHGNDYDLNGDDVWDVFDLCLMKRRYLSQNKPVPDKINEIPQGYYTTADEQGKLEELYYDTYESMTYDEKNQILNKRSSFPKWIKVRNSLISTL